MLTNVNFLYIFVFKIEGKRNSSLCIEKVLDLLFQLVEDGSENKHEFKFLFKKTHLVLKLHNV